jgi:hypothetical protein
MAQAPDVLAEHEVPRRGGWVRTARSCAVAPPLHRRGEDRVLDEVRTPARGANRIEILAMITREFSEMITRVSLDLVVRWLPMSLV